MKKKIQAESSQPAKSTPSVDKTDIESKIDTLKAAGILDTDGNLTNLYKEKPITFPPFTWIRCTRVSMWDNGKLVRGHRYLFMGKVTNGAETGDNVVLMDDRGCFTASIKEEDFEVC